jgi:hypothetical protein
MELKDKIADYACMAAICVGLFAGAYALTVLLSWLSWDVIISAILFVAMWGGLYIDRRS